MSCSRAARVRTSDGGFGGAPVDGGVICCLSGVGAAAGGGAASDSSGGGAAVDLRGGRAADDRVSGGAAIGPAAGGGMSRVSSPAFRTAASTCSGTAGRPVATAAAPIIVTTTRAASPTRAGTVTARGIRLPVIRSDRSTRRIRAIMVRRRLWLFMQTAPASCTARGRRGTVRHAVRRPHPDAP